MRPPLERATSIAERAGLRPLTCSTARFDLVGFSRFRAPSETLTIYIEGDGRAWHRRTQPSRDPSPHQPTGLILASLDPAPAVAYLARPGQFSGGLKARNADVSLWTSHRFSPEVLAAMDEAVSQLKQMAGARRLHLVGYSGGGAIAVLLAGRRQDVCSVRTVAGNLDHERWTRLHGVTPLYGSLNPVDTAQGLCALPQVHYVGDRDEVIPASIARSYASHACAGAPVTIRILTGISHRDGWAEAWPGLCREFYGEP